VAGDEPRLERDVLIRGHEHFEPVFGCASQQLTVPKPGPVDEVAQRHTRPDEDGCSPENLRIGMHHRAVFDHAMFRGLIELGWKSGSPEFERFVRDWHALQR
jgi:hypothetical protein